MSNCIVAQSGGPTAVINASLSGVIQAALAHPEINEIYGALNGIQGVLSEELISLNSTFNTDGNILSLSQTPGMYLGSCRFKLADVEKDDSQYIQIFNTFKKYDIGYFFYIGGNDSMDTVLKLSAYAKKINHPIRIIGVPKTIDNDLCVTDHTPGFGSAAKFVATTLLEIAYDTYIYDIESVTIVEIMGRNAGWLTAAAILARTETIQAPDFIYLPEVPFVMDKFLEDVRTLQKTKKNIIIAVSEGIKDSSGKFISAGEAKNDAFGHAQLSGTGKTLENIVKREIGCKVRSIELNVLQRSAMHCASQTDIIEAQLVGSRAVAAAIQGETGKMMAMKRVSNHPYTIEVEAISIDTIANHEKDFPLEWISPAGNDVTKDMITYALPLIMGEPKLIYHNGIPKYMDNSHLFKR